jgi:hypothetical protein
MIEQGCVGDRAGASALANNQQWTNRTTESLRVYESKSLRVYESTALSLLIVKTLLEFMSCNLY